MAAIARADAPMSMPLARTARMIAVIASRISSARMGDASSRLAGDERQCFEKILADLEDEIFRSGVSRHRVNARNVDEHCGGSEEIPPESSRDPDRAFDMQDLETTIVEQLLDAPLGGHE